MARLILIPGLGGDFRMFQQLAETGLEFEVLEHIPAVGQESMQAYAQRMAALLPQNEDFQLGGVSLGGLISHEIALHLGLKRVLIISSVKNSREIPFYFKMMRWMKLHRLFSGEKVKEKGPRNPFPAPPEVKATNAQMRQDTDPHFVTWAMNAVVYWRRPPSNVEFVHIHGNRDLMFPGMFFRKRLKVRGGSHIMVQTHAPQISTLIRQHFLAED